MRLYSPSDRPKNGIHWSGALEPVIDFRESKVRLSTMRLSARSDYGVRAVLDLAERIGQGPIQSEAIARRQGVSEAFLDQVLTLLRRAGLVQSTRGPRGGHVLIAAPEQLTLLTILEAVEGEEFLPSMPDSRGRGPGTDALGSGARAVPSVRVQQEVWERVRTSVTEILGGTTVADLLERQQILTAPARYYI